MVVNSIDENQCVRRLENNVFLVSWSLSWPEETYFKFVLLVLSLPVVVCLSKEGRSVLDHVVPCIQDQNIKVDSSWKR